MSGDSALGARRSAARPRLIRWKGLVPLGVFVTLVGVVWWFVLDPVVAWSVEEVGAQIVGAKVDVEEADVRPQDGVVMLRRLEVANPNAPMTNLIEADEIVVNVRVAPLLEKKVIIDTVAFRGIRFGTPRRTSGALDDPSPASGRALREVEAWTDRIQIPPLSLEGLRQVVNVDAIRAESLATLQAARAIPGAADSLRGAALERVRALNPEPVLDSARALATRLEGASVRTLGLAGARDAVGSARRTIETLTSLDERLAAVREQVGAGVDTLRQRIASLEEARRRDYAYARGLLNVPSLEGPDLAPALFGGMALERLAPVLYWAKLAEEYMPPGVERRLRQGPDRVRASGTNVVFPKREHLPGFLLRFGEASLEIGGEGVAAGAYAALVTGVSSAPAVYGEPATFTVERRAAQVGPHTLRAGGIVNHVGRPLRDSVAALVAGIGLPTVDLGPLGARLDLGQGTTDVLFRRTGDSLDARWTWRSEGVTWGRMDTSAAPAARGLAQQALGSAEDVLWRAVSRLSSVDINARLTGTIDRPRLAVGSNVAGAVANALREQLGEEIRRLEQQVRARVDALVADRVTEARQLVRGVQDEALGRIDARRQELEAVKGQLEAKVRELVRIPGIG